MGCLVVTWNLWFWAAEVGAIIVWVWCHHAHAHLSWSWAADALQSLLRFLVRPGCSVDATGVLAATFIGMRWSQSPRHMFRIPLRAAAHQLVFGIRLISTCKGCSTSSGPSAKYFLACILLLRHTWIHRMRWIRLQRQIKRRIRMALPSWATATYTSLILSFDIRCSRKVSTDFLGRAEPTKVTHAVWILV